MSVRRRRLILTAPALAAAFVFGMAQALGQNAYISNFGDGTVSVIDTATNTAVATISVGGGPTGVAVNSDGSKAYIANHPSGPLAVIDTATGRILQHGEWSGGRRHAGWCKGLCGEYRLLRGVDHRYGH